MRLYYNVKEEHSNSQIIILLGGENMIASRKQAIDFIKTVPDDRLDKILIMLNKVYESSKSFSTTRTRRKLGGMEGKICIADDFKAPLDCFEDYMP